MDKPEGFVSEESSSVLLVLISVEILRIIHELRILLTLPMDFITRKQERRLLIIFYIITLLCYP